MHANRDPIDEMPYIRDEAELYKDNALEIREEREERRRPYVGRIEKIREMMKDSGAQTSIMKKMIKDMQGTEIEKLQTIGSKVVGNIFDRVKFLKARIRETQLSLQQRQMLNKVFNGEIDKDIEEMENIIASLSKKEDIRDFKLNVSLLRMEKRKENTSYWRDVTALNKQMQELNEQLEMETNISNLLADLDAPLGLSSPSKPSSATGASGA